MVIVDNALEVVKELLELATSSDPHDLTLLGQVIGGMDRKALHERVVEKKTKLPPLPEELVKHDD